MRYIYIYVHFYRLVLYAVHISIYNYIYIFRTQMTSIIEGKPLKTRPFPTKTRVIWVPGIRILFAHIFFTQIFPAFWNTPAKFPRGEFLGRTLHTERFSELSTSVFAFFFGGRPKVKVKVQKSEGKHYLLNIVLFYFQSVGKMLFGTCCYRNVWKIRKFVGQNMFKNRWLLFCNIFGIVPIRQCV